MENIHVQLENFKTRITEIESNLEKTHFELRLKNKRILNLEKRFEYTDKVNQYLPSSEMRIFKLKEGDTKLQQNREGTRLELGDEDQQIRQVEQKIEEYYPQRGEENEDETKLRQNSEKTRAKLGDEDEQIRQVEQEIEEIYTQMDADNEEFVRLDELENQELIDQSIDKNDGRLKQWKLLMLPIVLGRITK